MAKQNRFIKLLSDSIAKSLIESGYVIADDEDKFKLQIYDILMREHELDKEIEEEAERVLQENADEVLYRGVPFFKARKLIKEKIAKERGIQPGSIFSREKANYLAGKILKLILSDESLDYTVERGVLRQAIVKKFEDVIKLRKEIDQAVRDKIASHSKPIPEGSPEWYALYRRYYNEELIERGLVDTQSEM
jgi:hypothetical protein